VRHVERGECQRYAGAHHDVGRFRIDMHVEFRMRCHVACDMLRPAHHHDLAQFRGDIRGGLQRRRDIGERAERHEGHRALGPRPHRLDDEIDGMRLLQRHLGLWQVGAVKPGCPVHMLCCHRITAKRAITAGMNRHIGAPGQLADHPRIARGVLQRHVSGHAGQAKNLQLLGAGKGQKDRHRVVLSRIRINDDLLRCHLSLSPGLAPRQCGGYAAMSTAQAGSRRGFTACESAARGRSVPVRHRQHPPHTLTRAGPL